jgi:hypothetical protein
MRNLRARLERLEQQAATAPAEPMPSAFWDWLGHGGDSGTPEERAECRAYWLGLDALWAEQDPLGYRCRAAGVDPIELKIEALLVCPPGAPPAAVEAKMWEILNGPPRPPLPIGLRELPKEDRHEP